jgi:hypothetical protein
MEEEKLKELNNLVFNEINKTANDEMYNYNLKTMEIQQMKDFTLSLGDNQFSSNLKNL